MGPHSALTPLSVGIDLLQQMKSHPEHTVTLMLGRKKGRILALRESFQLYLLFGIYSMNFNFTYPRLISTWHSSLIIASRANSDQSHRHGLICHTVIKKEKLAT